MWFSDSLVHLGEWFSLGSRYSSEGGIFKRLKVRGGSPGMHKRPCGSLIALSTLGNGFHWALGIHQKEAYLKD